jgi:hypothetical protein
MIIMEMRHSQAYWGALSCGKFGAWVFCGTVEFDTYLEYGLIELV